MDEKIVLYFISKYSIIFLSNKYKYKKCLYPYDHKIALKIKWTEFFMTVLLMKICFLIFSVYRNHWLIFCWVRCWLAKMKIRDMLIVFFVFFYFQVSLKHLTRKYFGKRKSYFVFTLFSLNPEWLYIVLYSKVLSRYEFLTSQTT